MFSKRLKPTTLGSWMCNVLICTVRNCSIAMSPNHHIVTIRSENLRKEQITIWRFKNHGFPIPPIKGSLLHGYRFHKLLELWEYEIMNSSKRTSVEGKQNGSLQQETKEREIEKKALMSWKNNLSQRHQYCQGFAATNWSWQSRETSRLRVLILFAVVAVSLPRLLLICPFFSNLLNIIHDKTNKTDSPYLMLWTSAHLLLLTQ